MSPLASFQRDRVRRVQRLIQVFDDVIDMLNTDAKPDSLRRDASLALLFDRHLAMGRGGGMTGERFGITQVDQAFDQR